MKHTGTGIKNSISEDQPRTLDSLFGLPNSLLVPTLFDLMVHVAPDRVLGDGGSLYLKIPLPPSEQEKQPPCLACPFGEKAQKNNTYCHHRAYLVSTTRDHARVEIGRGFYCTNPNRYRKAGKLISQVLTDKQGPVPYVYNKLKEMIENTAPDPISSVLPLDKELFSRPAMEYFKLLFMPNLELGTPSKCTKLLQDVMHKSISPDKLRTSGFDFEAHKFACGKDGESAPTLDSMSTLFHQVAIFRFSQEPEERNAAIRGIIWELFRHHQLLADCNSQIQSAILEVRATFPHLGLSGWSAAFARPVILRSIENPFESRDYPDWCNRWAQNSGYGSEEDLPIPVWGDLARGHQDKLEREGRPFLVVPIKEKNKKGSLGFLRVATKREGERQFTSADLDRLMSYADHLARFLLDHGFPLQSDPASPAKEKDTNDSQFWWSLHLHGAVKGHSLMELGDLAAKGFRETFDATAASVYLREDLWSPMDLQPVSDSPMPDQKDGRRYVLWGTDIEKAFVEVEQCRQIKFDEFRKCIGSLELGAYTERTGKTGWTIKNKAALLAYYEGPPTDPHGKDIERVVIRLSATQVLAAKKDREKWVSDARAGTIAQDPNSLDQIINSLLKRQGSKGDKCEIEDEQHCLFMAATLIDPDTSPEPLGVVRMIFKDIPDICLNDSTHTLDSQIRAAVEKILVPMAQFARSFCRLLRQHAMRSRLLHAVTNMVRQSSFQQKPVQDGNIVDQPVRNLAGGMMAAGPFGEAAASLLGISEASAVTIFIKNEFAPTAFRDDRTGRESWVAVGSAAATDALTNADRIHFIEKFCREYLTESPRRACRYYEDTGRTGRTIKAGQITDWEPLEGSEDSRSGYACEVTSPSAFLVVPTPAIRPESRQRIPKSGVIAAVRFVRTQERRRAKFLDEEKDRLAAIVDLLQHLVPSWSRQNAYDEFKDEWDRKIKNIFPKVLRDAVREQVLSDAVDLKILREETLQNEEGKDKALKILGADVPIWALSQNQQHPFSRTADDVRRDELSLLSWFLLTLARPKSETSIQQLVGQVLRGLIRIHSDPRRAKSWIERLNRLERFEPILAEIPRYRDHSVHQFQVFLIGWILLRFIKGLKLIDILYRGWELPSDNAECLEKNKPSGISQPQIGARVWLLASLFHDVAYPLEHAYSWANLFGRELTGASREFEFVAKASADMLFKKESVAEIGDESALNRTPDFAKSYEYLTQELIPLLSDRPEANTAITSMLDELMRKWDHGMWAAVMLLQTSAGDTSPEVIRAAVAIALHNKLAGRLIKWRRKLLLNDEKTIVPFMLLLCDSLHEWGRDFWNTFDRSPDFSEMDRRPSLKMIGKQADDSEIFLVDIAMGSECENHLLQQKTEELKALRDILIDIRHTNRPAIVVRVCRESMNNIADVLLKDQTVEFWLG